MSAATPADLANGIKLLERLRAGELQIAGGAKPAEETSAMLQRVENVLRTAYMRTVTPIGDGGPAYPTDQSQPEREDGMSLRDYFAAKAMQAEMITTFSDATPESANDFISAAKVAGRSLEDHLAFNAYFLADAMLKARQA